MVRVLCCAATGPQFTMTKPKSRNAQLKELRGWLHYFQDQARAETRWLKLSRAKCKEIAARMRELQKGIK